MELRKAMIVAAAGWTRLLDLALPPQCIACDALVDVPGRLCAACFRAVTFLGEPCCARCGHGFAHLGQAACVLAGQGPLCSGCAERPPAWSRARGALLYDEASRRLVLGLKYADRVDQAAPLAAMMARAGAVLLRDADVLVPVPLHRSRLLSRRYNQAALLARALARLTRRRLAVDALRRTKRTISLGHLDAAARREALHGAFRVAPSRHACIRDRRVVLVDDVLTSGSTADACATVLLDAGAASVDVLVAARVGHVGVG